MNYSTHYTLLIERAKLRTLTGYKEAHHIIPKCLGGSNDPANLVDLTAREHYIAHLLLAKIYGGALWHAINLMGRLKKYSNRHYETARIEHSKLLSEHNRRIKTKAKESRQYVCVHCSKRFNRVEFCHHPIRERAWCSQSCAGKYNGKHFVSHSSRNKGNVAWNKGLPNPNSAENARKGALKLASKVTGRTRLYKADGSWTWQYSKE
jgi:hypothetical protein